MVYQHFKTLQPLVVVATGWLGPEINPDRLGIGQGAQFHHSMEPEPEPSVSNHKIRKINQI